MCYVRISTLVTALRDNKITDGCKDCTPTRFIVACNGQQSIKSNILVQCKASNYLT